MHLAGLSVSHHGESVIICAQLLSLKFPSKYNCLMREQVITYDMEQKIKHYYKLLF